MKKIIFNLKRWWKWFAALQHKNKVLICFGLGALIVLLIYMLKPFISLEFSIALLIITKKLDSENPYFEPSSVGLYEEIIIDIIHEALCKCADQLGIQKPQSKQGMRLPQEPYKDRFPRLYVRGKKKLDATVEIDGEEIIGILEELHRVYLMNCPRHVSLVFSGLVVENCNDYDSYYKFSIMPSTKDTLAYLRNRKHAQFMKKSASVNKPSRLIYRLDDIQNSPFCRKESFLNYSRISPIKLDLDIYPHLLCIGATGSGKTYALQGIVSYFLSASNDSQLFVLDFKGQDYELMVDYENYYSHIVSTWVELTI